MDFWLIDFQSQWAYLKKRRDKSKVIYLWTHFRQSTHCHPPPPSSTTTTQPVTTTHHLSPPTTNTTMLTIHHYRPPLSPTRWRQVVADELRSHGPIFKRILSFTRCVINASTFLYFIYDFQPIRRQKKHSP